MEQILSIVVGFIIGAIYTLKNHFNIQWSFPLIFTVALLHAILFYSIYIICKGN